MKGLLGVHCYAERGDKSETYATLMSPMNLDVSTPPNVNSPLTSSGPSIGSKDMETDRKPVSPWLNKFWTTVNKQTLSTTDLRYKDPRLSGSLAHRLQPCYLYLDSVYRVKGLLDPSYSVRSAHDDSVLNRRVVYAPKNTINAFEAYRFRSYADRLIWYLQP